MKNNDNHNNKIEKKKMKHIGKGLLLLVSVMLLVLSPDTQLKSRE